MLADFETEYVEPPRAFIAAHCQGCRGQAWLRLATGIRCRDCGRTRALDPLVSGCCEAPTVEDATRVFCGECGQCLHDRQPRRKLQ